MSAPAESHTAEILRASAPTPRPVLAGTAPQTARNERGSAPKRHNHTIGHVSAMIASVRNPATTARNMLGTIWRSTLPGALERSIGGSPGGAPKHGAGIVRNAAPRWAPRSWTKLCARSFPRKPNFEVPAGVCGTNFRLNPSPERSSRKGIPGDPRSGLRVASGGTHRSTSKTGGADEAPTGCVPSCCVDHRCDLARASSFRGARAREHENEDDSSGEDATEMREVLVTVPVLVNVRDVPFGGELINCSFVALRRRRRARRRPRSTSPNWPAIWPRSHALPS